MAMLTNLDLIRRVPLFSMLSAGHAEFLAEAVTKRRFMKGERFVEQDGKADALFIILAGRARVVMCDGKGGEVILATLQAGDYIGEMSLLDNEPHSASVEAETQTDVLELGRADFTRALADSNAMSYSIMLGLVRRLRRADDKIGSLALMSVFDRVAGVLLDTAKASPYDDMIIRQKLSRQDIAKTIGASREMVSRVMKDFETSGFIVPLEGGAMQVKDRRTGAR